MKKIFCLLLACALLICGCTNTSEKNKTVKEISNSDNSNLYNFTDNEIESAKKIAEIYYNNTNYSDTIENIKYDLNNSLYNQHSSDYEKGNLITFSVYTKDTATPPREIALARKSKDSNWEVINEGY